MEWLQSSTILEKDIFGFDRDQRDEKVEKPESPIKGFDVELMLELLKRKSIGTFEGNITFPNAIRWGDREGSVMLEVAPNFGFSIKKLGVDKQGNPRWATKKLFQLNRQGYGGYEDSVAQEVFTYLQKTGEGMIEAPKEEYDDLENLAHHIYGKLKRTAKNIFIPEGMKKLHDDAFIIKLGVKGSGLEARHQTRVEQNQTFIGFDRDQGVIRITNYNLLSPVGGGHEFRISPSDFDCYFFPTQGREEIAETIATRMRYY
jgi:hypothetical protein